MSLPSKHKQTEKQTNSQTFFPGLGGKSPQCQDPLGPPPPWLQESRMGRGCHTSEGRPGAGGWGPPRGEQDTTARQWKNLADLKKGRKRRGFACFVFAFNESWGVKWERRPSRAGAGQFHVTRAERFFPARRLPGSHLDLKRGPPSYLESLRLNHPREFR